MDSNVVVPLLSLSADAMVTVFSKMNNVEIVKISKTCSYANKVIKANGSILSSRPLFGDHFMLEAFLGGIRGAVQQFDEYGLLQLSKFFQINDVSYFIPQISPISISTLTIRVFDREVVSQMLGILNKWRPVCDNVHIYDYMRNAQLLEMVGYLRCHTSLKIDLHHTEFRKTVDELKQLRNHKIFNINVSIAWTDKNDILDTMKCFAEFRTRTIPYFMNELLFELTKTKEFGNLRHFSLCVPNKDKAKFPYLPSEIRTPMTTIILSDDSRDTKDRPRSIRKLPLRNHMCALIVELWEELASRFSTSKMDIQVEIMENDDEMILDYILRNYSIHCQFFTRENRKRYLAMDDENRAKRIKIAFHGYPEDE